MSLKFLEQNDFVCNTYNKNLFKLSCTSFALRKHLNGFRRQKSFTMKACAEFYCRQIARKFSLKFPQCITNLERLIQTGLLLFWSVSEFRVLLFSLKVVWCPQYGPKSLFKYGEERSILFYCTQEEKLNF